MTTKTGSVTEWETELIRLASLVGTDAKNPEKKLLSFVSKTLTHLQEQTRREERQKMHDEMQKHIDLNGRDENGLGWLNDEEVKHLFDSQESEGE